MPEPIAIASAAIATSATAYKISCSLYDFIRSANKVDKTLELLYAALIGLNTSLKSVEVTLRSEIVRSAAMEEQSHSAALQAIDQSLQDCQHSLKALSSVLYDVALPQEKLIILKRTVYQVKFNTEQGKINNLRLHIQAYSTSLQIALQTLTLAVTCQSSNKIPEDLSTKIDALVDLISDINIHEVTEVNQYLPPEYGNDAIVGHTTTLLQHAESVVSEAKTVLSVTSKAGSRSTITDGQSEYPHSETDHEVYCNPQDRVRVLDWISSRRTAKAQPSDNETLPDHLHPLSSADSDTLSRVKTPDTAMSKQLKQTQEDTYDSDVEEYEFEAISMLFSRGTFHMVRSEFKDAEPFFHRGILKTESMHLVVQRRLNIQEQRLRLALSQLYQGRIDLALPSLEAFSQGISEDNQEAARALEASHALVQAYSTLDDHELAIDQCKKTIKGNTMFYGKHHPLYKRSMNLLAAIYNSSGDTMMSSVYADIASSSNSEVQNQQDGQSLESLIGFEGPPLDDIRASYKNRTEERESSKLKAPSQRPIKNKLRSRHASDSRRKSRSASNETLVDSVKSSLNRKSRLHDREEELDSDAESSLLKPQLSPTEKTTNQPSFKPGISQSPYNNPKLLEKVEDAIRRLILPELAALRLAQTKPKPNPH